MQPEVPVPSVDHKLSDWQTLAGDPWPTLLIGNGASINLWEGFSYRRLFDAANLPRRAGSIFEELSTTNFETALECLQHARIVQLAFNRSTALMDRTYSAVRDALFGAVNDAHIDWGDIPSSTRTTIATSVAEYESVYTTNYDLCLYWSHMDNARSADIRDYFWSPGMVFDPANTRTTIGNPTLIHYLHGALHLWTNDATGQNGKWTARTGNLRDLEGRYRPGVRKRPLFISEGTSPAKLRSIRRSTYLSFCLERLRSDSENTVVFGHSLSSQDDHIVKALNAGAKRRIAVSIRPTNRSWDTVAEKGRILRALNQQRVVFFDSTTHPLGDPALRVHATT